MSQPQINFKMVVPVRYLFNHRLWDRVCEELGWDVYAVNEGRMQMDDLVTIDVIANPDLCIAITAAYSEGHHETD